MTQASEATQQSDEERLSDEALARSTGYTWNEWFAILDAQGAADRSRADVADFLSDGHGMSRWWANTITVGYERARRDRAKPERLNGHQMTATKTFPVTLDRLFAAFVESSGREQWLGNADLRLRGSEPNRLAHFDWRNGSSRVSAYFTDKGGKSTVRVQHGKLLSAKDAEAMKLYWRARLAELQRALDREAIPDL